MKLRWLLQAGPSPRAETVWCAHSQRTLVKPTNQTNHLEPAPSYQAGLAPRRTLQENPSSQCVGN